MAAAVKPDGRMAIADVPMVVEADGSTQTVMQSVQANMVPAKADAVPKTPGDGSLNVGTTPTLTASSSGTDQFDAPVYRFLVCQAYDVNFVFGVSCGKTTIADSGWISAKSWKVPSGKMAANHTYSWTVSVKDAGDTPLLVSGTVAKVMSAGATRQSPDSGDFMTELIGPSNGSTTTSLTPKLTGHATMAMTQDYQYNFKVFTCASAASCADGTQVADSGWLSAGSYTIPAKVLRRGVNYVWSMDIRNNPYVSESGRQHWAFGEIVPLPTGTNYGSSSATTAINGVDLGDRHYSTAETDASVTAPGGNLALVRTYSSSNPTATAFGTGWSSVVNMTIAADSVGETVRMGDGHEVAFGLNPDGSFGVDSRNAGMTLTGSGGNFVLTDVAGNRYTFTANVLTAMTNAQGLVTDVKQASGKVFALTDRTSGRSVGLVWSGAHVVAAFTSAAAITAAPSAVPTITAPAASWTYTYSGNTLTKACRSGAHGGCSSYGYSTDVTPLLTSIRNTAGAVQTQIGYSSGSVNVVADEGGSTRFAATTGSKGDRVTVTKQSGEVDTYTTNLFGEPVGLRTSLGAATNWEYNLAGQMTSMKSDSSSLYVEYDDAGRVTRHRDALGSQSYTYVASGNGAGKLATASLREYLTGSVPGQAYQYDASGRITAIVAGAAGSTQRTTKYAYTTGKEAAVGGGTVPAGLTLSTTNAAGKTQSFGYDKLGQLTTETDLRGLVRIFGYDGLGNLSGSTVTMPGASSPYQTSTYRYGADGRLASATGPASADVVSGDTRQLTQQYTYDDNGNVLTSTDVTAAGNTHTTTYTYDTYGRPLTVTGPSGAPTHTFTYDTSGNLATDTDARGTTNRFTYDPAGHRLTTTADYHSPTGFGSTTRTLETNTYAPSGQLSTRVDAAGQKYAYTYRTDNLVATITAKNVPAGNGTREDLTVASYLYDEYGLIAEASMDDAKHVVTMTYDQFQQVTEIKDASQAQGPGAIIRDTAYTYDALGNRLTATDLDGSRAAVRVEQFAYDPAGALTSDTVRSTATSTDATTTWYQRDGAGRLTGVTDPNGAAAGDTAHTTTYTYAADDLPVRQAGPATAAGSATTTIGYDGYGRQNALQDPAGAITTVTFDKNGNVLTQADPSHDVDGKPATTRATYDAAGDVTAVTDPAGATTTYEYDSAGNRVRTTAPAFADGGASRVTTAEYDAAGNVTSSTSAAGVNTTATYDTLGRLTSSTLHVRVPFGTDDRTTSVDYFDAGYGRTTTAPGGGSTTELSDAFGQLVSVADADKVATTYGYDLLGNQTTATDSVGTTETRSYNPRGEITATSVAAADGTVLRTGAFGYDNAGNQTSVTDPRGNTTDLGYDAVGNLTSITDPGLPAATAMYDLVGQQTGYTDPTGAATTATYTPAGDLATLTAPATPQQPDPAARTRSYGYDADGRQTSTDEPGDVHLTNTYDTAGNLTAEKATHGSATGNRSFGYDADNRMITFSTGAGNETLSYDDSGAVTEASGPAGDATFGYDPDGNETSRADPSGNSTSTYTPAGRIKTLTVAGVSSKLTYAYDAAGRTRTITAGTATQRTIEYDPLGQLLTDTVKNASGATVYGQSNTWDAAGNLTAATVSPDTSAGAGTTAYTYGADEQLTSWTAPGKPQQQITWDGAGRPTQVGDEARTYNGQGQLLTAGTRSYTYSNAGALTATADGDTTTKYSYDEFGQLTGDGSSTYSYDALGRLTASGSDDLTYAGTSTEPATVGKTALHRTTQGALAFIDGAEAITNSHGDLSAELTGATLTGSSSYDPFGTVTSTSGTMSTAIGFQSQVTSGTATHMGSRWYDSSTGGFLTRDTGAVPLNQQSRYSYGAANPITNADPNGTCVGPVAVVCAGGAIGAEVGTAVEPGGGTIIGGALGAAVGGIALGAGVRCATMTACTSAVRKWTKDTFQYGSGSRGVTMHLNLPDLPVASHGSWGSIGAVNIPKMGPINIPKIGPINIPTIAPININIDLSGLTAWSADFEAYMPQLQKSMAALTTSMAALNVSMTQFAAYQAKIEKGPPAWVRTGVVPVGTAVAGTCAGIGGSGLTSCSPVAAAPTLTTAVLPEAQQSTTVLQAAAQAGTQAPATSGGTSSADNGGCQPGQVQTSVGCETLTQLLQRIVTRESERLSGDPSAIEEGLSSEEMGAVTRRPFLGRVNVGKAMERAVKRDADVAEHFEHIGGNSPVDFIGRSDGLGYEMTTDTPSTLARHLARPGVDATRIATYSMRRFARYLAQLFGK
jgi:RHS repeat-associated protein